MEDIEKIKIELTGMKTVVSKMKNTLSRTNGRSVLTKEKVSELEHTAMETIQNEMEREKKNLRKKKRSLLSSGIIGNMYQFYTYSKTLKRRNAS